MAPIQYFRQPIPSLLLSLKMKSININLNCLMNLYVLLDKLCTFIAFVHLGLELYWNKVIYNRALEDSKYENLSERNNEYIEKLLCYLFMKYFFTSLLLDQKLVFITMNARWKTRKHLRSSLSSERNKLLNEWFEGI